VWKSGGSANTLCFCGGVSSTGSSGSPQAVVDPSTASAAAPCGWCFVQSCRRSLWGCRCCLMLHTSVHTHCVFSSTSACYVLCMCSCHVSCPCMWRSYAATSSCCLNIAIAHALLAPRAQGSVGGQIQIRRGIGLSNQFFDTMVYLSWPAQTQSDESLALATRASRQW